MVRYVGRALSSHLRKIWMRFLTSTAIKRETSSFQLVDVAWTTLSICSARSWIVRSSEEASPARSSVFSPVASVRMVVNSTKARPITCPSGDKVLAPGFF